jgi:hypothetical protein
MASPKRSKKSSVSSGKKNSSKASTEPSDKNSDSLPFNETIEVDRLKLEKMYGKLDKLSKKLSVPSNGEPASFHSCIENVRQAENALTYISIKMSPMMAQVKVTIAKAKHLLKYDTDSTAIKDALYREECRKISLTAFVECVDRLITNARHCREDISKKIKLLEMERN